MDIFFTQTNCDRCGASLAGGRTMSMFNTETICMACAEAERKRKDYAAAREAERAAVRAGDRNFEGVGL
jgi:ArsR family metal-binding transcriptional regulator